MVLGRYDWSAELSWGSQLQGRVSCREGLVVVKGYFYSNLCISPSPNHIRLLSVVGLKFLPKAPLNSAASKATASKGDLSAPLGPGATSGSGKQSQQETKLSDQVQVSRPAHEESGSLNPRGMNASPSAIVRVHVLTEFILAFVGVV